MQKLTIETEKKDLIHVPQGRVGRLMQSVDDIPFEGLATYSFISCSAIVFINKLQGKISLVHADQEYPAEELVTEMKWAGEECEIVILHHSFGKRMMEIFQKQFPKNKVKTHCLADELFGMSVCFNESSNNTLHPFITLYTKKQLPTNICRHPHEFEFSTIHNIQRLLSVRSLSAHKISRVIFSGRFWTTINPKEFKPRPFDEYDKHFLKSLLPKGYFESGKDVAEYAQYALSKSPNLTFEEGLKDFCLQIGLNLSYYTNQFDTEKCLRMDVDEVLKSHKNQTTSSKDKLFFDAIKEAVRNKTASADRIITILNTDQHQLSSDADEARSEIKGAIRNYKSKQVFIAQKLRNKDAEKTIDELSSKAKATFIAKNFPEAQELYQQCLALALRFVTNEEKILATYCYNVGRSAQFAHNDILAYRYISLTINLYTTYHKNDQEHLKKAMTALEEIIKVMIVSSDPQAKKIAENFMARNAHIATISAASSMTNK